MGDADVTETNGRSAGQELSETGMAFKSEKKQTTKYNQPKLFACSARWTKYESRRTCFQLANATVFELHAPAAVGSLEPGEGSPGPGEESPGPEVGSPGVGRPVEGSPEAGMGMKRRQF
jgi:hypothetical protein